MHPSQSTSSYYYLNDRNESVGPVGLDVIDTLVSNRQLRADVLVARCGDSQWIPYNVLHPNAGAPLTRLHARDRETPHQISAMGGMQVPIFIPPGTLPKPATNLIWAILVTIFCCLPLGIVAIVKASSVDSLYYSGHYYEAVRASRAAASWCGWIVLLSLLPYAIIILMALFVE